MNIRMARDGDAAAVGALARELALNLADPDPGLDSQAWFRLRLTRSGEKAGTQMATYFAGACGVL